jgi:hypothetical protein
MHQFKYLTNQLIALNHLLFHQLLDPRLTLSFNGHWTATIDYPTEESFSETSYERLAKSIQEYIFYLMETNKICQTDLYEAMQCYSVYEKKEFKMSDWV